MDANPAWVVSMLFLLFSAACVPPPLLPGHALPAKTAAFDLSGLHTIETTAVTVSDGGEPFEVVRQQAQTLPPSLVARFGLGQGVEVGMGTALPIFLRWSLFDQARHNTPVSLSVTVGASAWNVLGPTAGAHLSSQFSLGQVQIRPEISVWTVQRIRRWSVDLTGLVDHPPGSRHELDVVSDGTLVTVPAAIALPVALSRDQSITPLLAAAWSIDRSTHHAVSCSDCAVSISSVKLVPELTFLLGLRLEPRFLE